MVVDADVGAAQIRVGHADDQQARETRASGWWSVPAFVELVLLKVWRHLWLV